MPSSFKRRQAESLCKKPEAFPTLSKKGNTIVTGPGKAKLTKCVVAGVSDSGSSYHRSPITGNHSPSAESAERAESDADVAFGEHLPVHGVGVGVGPDWAQYLPPVLVIVLV